MIRFQGIEKSFGENRVLDGLDLEVERGQIYGLLGANGAGKSTAIHILCGLLEADAGEATVQGAPLTRDSRRSVGVASQEISLYLDLTTRESLRFFARVYGLQGIELERRVDETLNQLRLTSVAETPVHELSGGWRRRLHLAVSLVHRPSVLILDEPTAGLDLEARFELWQVIEGLRDEGVALLLTTHLLEEAERLCDRVGILHEGRLAAEGTLDELEALVDAAEMLVVDSPDEAALRRRAEQLGWPVRSYAGRCTLWLPERASLLEWLRRLEPVPVVSASLEPVGLGHVYLEVTRGPELKDRRFPANAAAARRAVG